MANYTLSPSMSLPVPTVGVATAPAWASLLDSCLSIIDSHSHVPGSGVPITPSAMSITSSIPMQGNGLTSTGSIVFLPTTQTASNLLYESGVDLHYIDGNGNDVRLTASGAVNATSSGIASGTASASFSAGVLIVNSATATPANIQAGSILLGNNVTSSKFLTLAPPAAMGANIVETLPTIPVATSFMQMDTSGNMSASVPISAGLTGSNLASQTIAQGNLALRPTGTSVAAGGVAISSSSGGFTTSSGTDVAITNLNVTLVTTGRPVMLLLSQPSSGFIGTLQALSSGSAFAESILTFYRGATPVGSFQLGNDDTLASAILYVPPGSASAVDVVAAGTYTYSVNVRVTFGSFAATNCVLLAYEL